MTQTSALRKILPTNVTTFPTSTAAKMTAQSLDTEPMTTTNDDDDVPNVLPESTAYWSKPPYAWSSSFNYVPPRLTSSHCAKALYDLFHNTYYDQSVDDPSIPNFLLSVVVESSSHPTGLHALFAQPYVYAGPGLGNMDECPLQTCIAGGKETDSFTFAAVCIVPECSAYDLAAEDFSSVAERQLIQPYDFDYSDVSTTPTPSPMRNNLEESEQLGHEYVQLLQTISEINRFLRGGWTCGNFVVPWTPANSIFCVVLGCVMSLSLWSWRSHRRKRHSALPTSCEGPKMNGSAATSDTITLMHRSVETTDTDWSSVFDVSEHFRSLIAPSRVPCIDGMRVGSMVWIILGHVMAIQSSMGAGYANPSNFLPPSGWTTTLIGQLLFSSRMAVDTFLVLSGYLVVQVMHQKIQIPAHVSVWLFYCRRIPGILLGRIVRILPLYATSMGLYTLVAPHLGSGPFWHQWLALLKPCHDYGWSNLFFVNNFWPPNTPTTSTCFYHSWYLAVDMQLFAIAPLFVFFFQKNKTHAMVTMVLLFVALVVLSAYLGHENHWSINTFDGAAIDRFDVEAYAKPHTRAQAYLVGMFTSMLQYDRPAQQARMTWMYRVLLYLSLVVMALVAFCTVTGAYARRPCTYKEDPFKDDCGSIWSEQTTWLYTTFGRSIWSISLAIVLAICVEGKGTVTTILSWSCWGPLSRLTFGAYLVHPIIIFVWQLADREKSVFRLYTFCMNYLSVCCVSYVIAFTLYLTVESPSASIWKRFMKPRGSTPLHTTAETNGNGIIAAVPSAHYGATS